MKSLKEQGGSVRRHLEMIRLFLKEGNETVRDLQKKYYVSTWPSTVLSDSERLSADALRRSETRAPRTTQIVWWAVCTRAAVLSTLGWCCQSGFLIAVYHKVEESAVIITVKGPPSPIQGR